tara:strand:- start:127 stop:762 length:636 start_codon:yes stop_codon:yes gene_type:complete
VVNFKQVSYSQLSKGSRAIVAKFELATSHEVQLGIDWYESAWSIARRIAKQYDMMTATVAAVIAALSPNNKWERNVKDAENIIKAFKYGEDDDVMAVKCCTYTMNKIKALNILKTKDLNYPAILKGAKTIEFYHCIMLEDDVCIDGHAYSIWYDERLTMKEVPNIGKKLRATIKQDYKDATSFINEELGTDYLPSTIQAITWVTHKRIYNV